MQTRTWGNRCFPASVCPIVAQYGFEAVQNRVCRLRSARWWGNAQLFGARTWVQVGKTLTRATELSYPVGNQDRGVWDRSLPLSGLKPVAPMLLGIEHAASGTGPYRLAG